MGKISTKSFKLKKPKVFTKGQELADSIYSYFDKQLNFGRIMKMIKTKGYQAVYEIFNEVKKSNPRHRLALFIYKIRNNKVVFAEKEKTESF